MAFQHYFQLIRHYRQILLRIILGTTILAAVMSLYWLLSSPVFTATTKVVILPSDSELAFTDIWLRGSDMSPANIMTETHIEYLLSRPVIESTIEKISAQSEPEEQSLGSKLRELLSQGKEMLRRLYHIVNYGEYVPLSTHQIAIDQLRRGIDVRAVEGSYLLEISVSHESRENAAIAANTLAEAYIERAAAQAKESGEKLRDFLQAQIKERELQISNLIEREYQLRKQQGIITLEEAQSMLMSMQETQRGKELDNQARLKELEVKLNALKKTQRGVKSQSIQAKIEEAITLGEAEKQGIARSQPLRLHVIDEIVKEVNALGIKERPLLVLQRQRDHLEADITDLQKRLVVADLAASNAISKMRVVELAVPPRYPASPKVVTNTGVGLLTGLLFVLFVVIALDTFSSKVITNADIQRLAGERFIGRLRLPERTRSGGEEHIHSLSAAAIHDNVFSNTPSKAKGLRAWLSTFVNWISPRSPGNQSHDTDLDMERQLSILGAFDTPGLDFTGFCSETVLQQVAEQVSMHLQSAGINVASSDPSVDNNTTNDNTSQPDKRTLSPPPIQALKPVSSALQWKALTSRGTTLVCVIPAGEINTQMIEDFQRQAIHSGINTFAFVLLET